jgi:streptomycin 6-kinase
MTDIVVPDELRRTVLRWFGEEGERWLAAVPGEAERLRDRWRLRLGAPYTGGSNALVLTAATEDGQPAVLKIPIRDEENVHEAAALRAYAGDGAVRLLTYEEQTGAMLLERADPGTPLSAWGDLFAAIDIAASVMRRLRRPAPEGVPLARVVDVAGRWAQTLSGLDLPGHSRLVDEAVRLASAYAAAPVGPDLLINRDAHLDNILRAGRQRWLLIDPKPMIGEAAFEAGHPVLNAMRHRPPETMRPDYVDRLVIRWAMGLGADPVRVRGWALIRAVQNVQWALEIDEDPAADLAEAVALSAGALSPHAS